MTPEQINMARAWLSDPRAAPMPEEITDTIEEALEIAMEAVLQRELDEAAIATRT
jgi:ABC-type uncharacterized transport system fused permease/ATPase subunit